MSARPRYCEQCGATIEPGAAFCAECGAPAPAPAAAAQPARRERRPRGRRRAEPAAPKPRRDLPTDRLAIVAFGAAIACLLGIGSLAAVVLGHRSLRRIAGAGGELGGRLWATAALAIGYASLAVAAVIAGWVVVNG